MKKVEEFAAKAHLGQTRKYTGEPYINHPLSVRDTLQKLYPKASEVMLFAAVLHDTVEDTSVTSEDIQTNFGHEVATLVYWLTDKSKREDGNRKARKEIDRKHIAAAPFDAQIVKLADLIDNTSSIVQHDKKFAKVYLAEKALLLDAMKDEVKETFIFKTASQVLWQAEQSI